MRRTALISYLFVALLPTRSPAQPRTAPAVTGHVIDALSRAPIAGALVVLTATPGGSLVTDGVTRAGTSALRVLTDSTGRYRFEGLARGGYSLHVTRLGYASISLEIDLGSGGAGANLTVGLQVEPLELEPIVVVRPGARPLAERGRETRASEGVTAAHMRQDRYLEPDVRAITAEAVDAAIPLVEPDLFRTMQRLPGVSGRDENLADPWVRAAPGGRTRTYLDGVPLYDPLHFGGFLSAIPPEAVAAGFLHMGVRPPELPEGGAAVIDFASREARSRPGLGTQSELTVAGIRAVTEQRLLNGRVGVVAGARRSLIDQAVSLGGADREGPFGYALSSWFVRGDVAVGSRTSLSFTRLRASDRIRGNVMSVIRATDAEWGSNLATLSLHSRITPGLRGSVTLASSDFSGAVRNAPDRGINRVDPDVVALDPGTIDLTWRAVRAAVATVETPGTRERLAGGLDFVRQHLDQRGSFRLGASTELPSATDQAGLEYLSAWGRARWKVTPAGTVEAGLRADLHEGRASVGGVGDLLLAPSLTLRLALAPGWTAQGAAGRSFLYAQQAGGAGTAFGPALHIGHRWLLAGPGVPAQRTDLASAGVEGWLSPDWLLSISTFARHSTGVATDIRGGFADLRVPAAIGTERTAGLELLLRRLAGRVTVSVGYAMAWSRMEVGGASFAPGALRAHQLDATVLARLGRGWRLGGGFTGYTGAPYVPVSVRCPAELVGAATGCLGDPRAIVGTPGTEVRRGPGYASADLLLDWQSAGTGVAWGFFLQVRNLTSRDNRGAYRGSMCDLAEPGGGCSTLGDRDVFERLFAGPFPSAGLRLRF